VGDISDALALFYNNLNKKIFIYKNVEGGMNGSMKILITEV
jgi:hypothetical protein